MIESKIDNIVTKLYMPFEYLYKKVGGVGYTVILVMILVMILRTCSPQPAYSIIEDGFDEVLPVGKVVVVKCDSTIYIDGEPVYIIVEHCN